MKSCLEKVGELISRIRNADTAAIVQQKDCDWCIAASNLSLLLCERAQVVQQSLFDTHTLVKDVLPVFLCPLWERMDLGGPFHDVIDLIRRNCSKILCIALFHLDPWIAQLSPCGDAVMEYSREWDDAKVAATLPTPSFAPALFHLDSDSDTTRRHASLPWFQPQVRFVAKRRAIRFPPAEMIYLASQDLRNPPVQRWVRVKLYSYDAITFSL